MDYEQNVNKSRASGNRCCSHPPYFPPIFHTENIRPTYGTQAPPEQSKAQEEKTGKKHSPAFSSFLFLSFFSLLPFNPPFISRFKRGKNLENKRKILKRKNWKRKNRKRETLKREREKKTKGRQVGG
ncbi:MAG: hypothetical protein PHV18_13200 [Lachnospiraceae bacterium]|nr:hypothetical protein [Lachnospiraceae bacterium]